MCLATPGRIVAITADDPALPVALVDFGSVTRTSQLLYVPEAQVGDYVIVQAGFAIRRLGEAEARETLRVAAEFADAPGSDPRSPSTPTRREVTVL
ncbi:MAG: HypC/HybG/HupF family hydrogenase formation chaperone [Thermoplasmata archaeon]|nr:HypC/HybG/HupF family hydrogenase formation chaperone [Thermoplasmata archaeon]